MNSVLLRKVRINANNSTRLSAAAADKAINSASVQPKRLNVVDKFVVLLFIVNL